MPIFEISSDDGCSYSYRILKGSAWLIRPRTCIVSLVRVVAPTEHAHNHTLTRTRTSGLISIKGTEPRILSGPIRVVAQLVFGPIGWNTCKIASLGRTTSPHRYLFATPDRGTQHVAPRVRAPVLTTPLNCFWPPNV